jgi:hypothetical protein
MLEEISMKSTTCGSLLFRVIFVVLRSIWIDFHSSFKRHRIIQITLSGIGEPQRLTLRTSCFNDLIELGAPSMMGVYHISL